MASWDKNKVLPENLNNGNEYANGDVPSLDTFNDANNNAFYAVDFAEAMADTPDTTNVGNVGTPAISLIDNVKNGITYKKFKFENFKGEQGVSIVNSGEWNSTTEYVNNANQIDVVVHNANLYICNTTNTNSEPAATNTNWSICANGIVSAVVSGMNISVTFADGTTSVITITGDIVELNEIAIDTIPTADSENLITSGGAFKLKIYDLVIRTQDDFDAMLASPTWLGAVSVALVGQFTLSTPDNSGVKIPATVKQIHGFNSAKITITNFVYNSSTGKGGLWYNTAPTTQDYSIRDLEVSCTGNGTRCYGFFNCNNLSNCTGTSTGTNGIGYGFENCNNLSNCTGTSTGTTGYGFHNCNNLSNCTGTSTGTNGFGYGFFNCNNLSNCTGTGTGTTFGYGFADIDYAVNCKDGGSSTDMWVGINRNIDLDTCVKTLVTADNSALNT